MTVAALRLLESDRGETSDNLDRGRVLAIVAMMTRYAGTQLALHAAANAAASLLG